MTNQAILFLSFGGPNGPDDVLPFMENVTRNRPIPRERLVEVSKHYYMFAGKSPINEINLNLIERLEGSLALRGIDLPVYFGNRNWEPYLEQAIQQMIDDGIKEALYFVTSAYSSFSGCRQYKTEVADVLEKLNAPIKLTKLRQFWDHPTFVNPFINDTILKIDKLSKMHPLDEIALLFSAHSIPLSMASTSDYVQQLDVVQNHILSRVNHHFDFKFEARRVYQSRSGPPSQPWLEPDISNEIANLCQIDQKRAFVTIPIGFISDHMEVIYDLDTLANSSAKELGASFERVVTPSDDPAFSDLIVDLIEEVTSQRPAPHIEGFDRPALQCRTNCCQIPPTSPNDYGQRHS
ncbi:ferrochelatase [Acidithrix ferrooxidans]|uniref:Coproporphyrin III ferrochelatase n=1 Tax=Acidithrix ferrooxidans TaxID=1280514 RepID=A0A0D8HDB8_9ACTN|nr:ferrochelatase [Acidithrix ferrooxidans]KJF15945.1 ferrochelatase [Acidithrix ferrooxidans]